MEVRFIDPPEAAGGLWRAQGCYVWPVRFSRRLWRIGSSSSLQEQFVVGPDPTGLPPRGIPHPGPMIGLPLIFTHLYQ